MGGDSRPLREIRASRNKNRDGSLLPLFREKRKVRFLKAEGNSFLARQRDLSSGQVLPFARFRLYFAARQR